MPDAWDIGLEYPEKDDPMKRWHNDPDLVVHVFPRDSDYAVAVELRLEQGTPPRVIGVAIRGTHMLSGDKEADVSPRDVQRMSLSRMVQAALAAAATAPTFEELPSGHGGEPLRIPNRPDVLFYDPGDDERRAKFRDEPWLEEARGRLIAPRGRPRRGEPAKSTKFYLDVLSLHDELKRRGERSPAQEIARRKDVDVNLVHQWLFRARRITRERAVLSAAAEPDGDLV